MKTGVDLTNYQEFALLDDGSEGVWLLQRPERVVRCDEPEAVAACVEEIEAGLAAGMVAAGFFTYELGYALESRLQPLMPHHRSLPLLRMALFRAATHLSRTEARRWLAAQATGPCSVDMCQSGLDRERYRDAFTSVRALIAAGDVYQINLTFKQRFRARGDWRSLYLDLQRRQRVGYGGLISTPEAAILSLSPELFVRVADGRAYARPMKGTAPRGITPDNDRQLAQWLASDEKSRAENLMIVDLIRNDLGRLAPFGGVRVSDLYRVETLRTLHQMTSGIEATLHPGIGLAELLGAVFPCGSVTGAPKIRAMEIIRAVESEPRGVYTGAIGLIRRDHHGKLDLLLNVAIRTLVIAADGAGELGIGSGVVYDSDADQEYEECLLKARFLTELGEPFALIETLRWDPQTGYALLDRHLDRLIRSATWFSIPCDREKARQRLLEAVADFGSDTMRVRLLVDEEGDVTLTAATLPPLPTVLRYAVAPHPRPSDDPLLYHKTTRREAYDAALASAKAATDCDDVVFVNERDELTEGSWTNVFVRLHGRLRTPALACGLLPGTLRAELLASGEATEAVLRPADLERAEAIYLGNSVRGLLPAEAVISASSQQAS